MGKKSKMYDSLYYWLTEDEPHVTSNMYRLHLTNQNIDGTHCDIIIRSMVMSYNLDVDTPKNSLHQVYRVSDDMDSIKLAINVFIESITSDRGYVKGEHVIAILATALDSMDTDFLEELRNEGHRIWSVVFACEPHPGLYEKYSARRPVAVNAPGDIERLIKCGYTERFLYYGGDCQVSFDLMHMFKRTIKDSVFNHRKDVDYALRDRVYKGIISLVDSTGDGHISENDMRHKYTTVPAGLYNWLYFGHYANMQDIPNGIDKYIASIMAMLVNGTYTVDCDVDNRRAIICEEWNKMLDTYDLIMSRTVTVGGALEMFKLPIDGMQIPIKINTPNIQFVEIDSAAETIPYLNEVAAAIPTMRLQYKMEISTTTNTPIDMLVVYDRATKTVTFNTHRGSRDNLIKIIEFYNVGDGTEDKSNLHIFNLSDFTGGEE